MSRRRYTEEFKVAAVRQVTVESHSAREVAGRLGISTHSLYVWKRRYGDSPERAGQLKADQVENQRLKKELKRVTEERDILKKAAVRSIDHRNTRLRYLALGSVVHGTNRTTWTI